LFEFMHETHEGVQVREASDGFFWNVYQTFTLWGIYSVQHNSEMPYGTTHKNWINPIFVAQQIHPVRHKFTNMCWTVQKDSNSLLLW
jgi:hypothetical protein